MIPVSSECSVAVTAGSIATTILCSSGASFTLASSIRPKLNKAPSTSSSISANNSCLPILVPSYRSLSIETADGARLSMFSNVLPLMTSVSLLVASSLMSFVGLGVVVIMHLGFCPSLSAIIKLSNVSLYLHDANSSHHAL